MKRKHWNVMTLAGIAALLVSCLLLELGGPRLLAQVLIVVGVIALFGGILGAIFYDSRHPLLRCPSCGRGIGTRYARGPGGKPRITGGEAYQCPYCGAMFQSWELKRHP